MILKSNSHSPLQLLHSALIYVYRRIFAMNNYFLPQILTWLCSRWISTGEYLFAMNIYRRVFVQTHLLRVDFLHPRIFQADTWLMHCSAEKKEFLHSSLLQNVTVFRFWSARSKYFMDVEHNGKFYEWGRSIFTFHLFTKYHWSQVKGTALLILYRKVNQSAKSTFKTSN